MLLFLLKTMPTGPTIVATSFDEPDPAAKFAATVRERGRGHYTVTRYEPCFSFDAGQAFTNADEATVRAELEQLREQG